jgi:hypothetical protein
LALREAGAADFTGLTNAGLTDADLTSLVAFVGAAFVGAAFADFDLSLDFFFAADLDFAVFTIQSPDEHVSIGRASTPQHAGDGVCATWITYRFSLAAEPPIHFKDIAAAGHKGPEFAPCRPSQRPQTARGGHKQ